LVKVKTPARGLGQPEGPVAPATTGHASTKPSNSSAAGAPASVVNSPADAFLGNFLAFGDSLKKGFEEAIENIVTPGGEQQERSEAQRHKLPRSQSQGSETTGQEPAEDTYFGPDTSTAFKDSPNPSSRPLKPGFFSSKLNSPPTANLADEQEPEVPEPAERFPEVEEERSEAAKGSTLQLLDGTDAMVRCMRKGSGALECPVCLQLFNRPVTPINADCRCTFCEICFYNIVKFGGRCVKCTRALPNDPSQCQINEEVKRAIEAFQQSGGEDASFATMMTGLKGQKDKAKYQMLDISEIRLDHKPLASGAYGQVFKGTWIKQNLAVAVKKVLRAGVMTREQTMESFRKEIDILAMLDHPHVLKLYGAVVDQDSDNICIVTELVPGGSLFDLIHTKPLLKPEAVIVIGTGVCKGMTYLHSMGIIHRDLKPGNLLMGAVSTPSGAQLVVKVADFGLARVQDSAKTMTGGIGTSQYTAPEVLKSQKYDFKADVFSFGVILWEIHARKIPYSDMNQMQIAVAVATQDYRPPPPKHCPAPFWQLMQHCWQTKPRERPSFAEILSQLEDMQFVFNLAASAHSGQSRQDQSSDAEKQRQKQQQEQQRKQQEQKEQQRMLEEQQRRLQQVKLQPSQSPSPPPQREGSAVQREGSGTPGGTPVRREPSQGDRSMEIVR